MDRRTFLAAAAAMPFALAVDRSAAGSEPRRGNAASESAPGLEETPFFSLPGNKGLLIQAPGWRGPELCSTTPRFVGSAVKTFILATYLREVEAGRLSEAEPMAIDDGVRSLSSPIFGAHPEAAKNLAGSTSARTILEAMISHSDNTATDAALRRVGVARVRDFIAGTVGLEHTRIPDSTRRMFSWLAGAGAGVDVGWSGMKQILDDHYFGEPRPPINDQQTMVSTAADLVAYYRRAVAGELFGKPETLTEFKRIQAMGDVISRVVPADTVAYAKGGSIDWLGFHALCATGQMLVGAKPVTFCFILNWTGSDDLTSRFAAAVSELLAAVAKEVH